MGVGHILSWWDASWPRFAGDQCHGTSVDKGDV